jgi:hypothetical protein
VGLAGMMVRDDGWIDLSIFRPDDPLAQFIGAFRKGGPSLLYCAAQAAV